MKPFLAALVLAGVALAGCSGDEAPIVEDDIPSAITRERVEELETLVSEFPRQVSFPGQEALPPLRLNFNGTLGPGDGATSVEMTRDDSVSELNPEYITFDLKEHVPEGQPVEINMNLKWHGDPGAGVDMDIYADVPGTHGAYDPEAWNWDFNWNIVNKARTVNTVHIAGEPFEVGMQVANGKILHPDGVDYELRVEILYADDVLAPHIPYALNVPDAATGLIIQSEPLGGEEHVTSTVVLIGPDDRLVRALQHNDIGTETLFIPVRGGGEYILYSQGQHGGFVRVETDVPNKDFEARFVDRTITDVPVIETIGTAIGAPDTPLDMSLRGDVDASGVPAPLVIQAYVRPAAGAAVSGQVLALLECAGEVVHHLEVTANIEGDFGRLGNRWIEDPDPVAMGQHHLSAEGCTYAFTTNAALGIEAGYRIVSYGR